MLPVGDILMKFLRLQTNLDVTVLAIIGQITFGTALIIVNWLILVLRREITLGPRKDVEIEDISSLKD